MEGVEEMRRFKNRGYGNRNAGASSILLALIACVLLLFYGGGCQKEVESAATASAPQKEDVGADPVAGAAAKLVVTYFHTTVRCPTCTLLEEYSRETVERIFAKEMQEGKIVFRHVNIQEPENKHFIQDYKLFSKSLIVSEVRGGEEVRWKNLPDIWRLVRDRDRYEQYVAGEIEAYLENL